TPSGPVSLAGTPKSASDAREPARSASLASPATASTPASSSRAATSVRSINQLSLSAVLHSELSAACRKGAVSKATAPPEKASRSPARWKDPLEGDAVVEGEERLPVFVRLAAAGQADDSGIHRRQRRRRGVGRGVRAAAGHTGERGARRVRAV